MVMSQVVFIKSAIDLEYYLCVKSTADTTTFCECVEDFAADGPD